MKKILHIIGKRPTGGIGSVVKNYQTFIDREECNFDYLIFNDNISGDFDEYVKKLGSKVFILPELRNHRLFRINRLVKQFFLDNKDNYDIVHLHSANIGFIILRHARNVGIKVRIIHSHATKYSDKKINSFRNFFLCKFSLHYATDYFYCSDAAKSFLFSSKSSRLFEMHNSIDTKKYSFQEDDRYRLRKELGIGDDESVLICTGRFSLQKNQMFLLKIAKVLQEKKLRFKIILVGDGPTKEKIDKSIIDMDLTENIISLGYRADIAALLSASDIFLLPSLYEGLPLSIVEAQCNGLICIMSDEITNELTFDSKKCFYINLNNLQKWINLIVDKIIDSADYTYREKAYLIANENHYNIEMEAKIVSAKYKQLSLRVD